MNWKITLPLKIAAILFISLTFVPVTFALTPTKKIEKPISITPTPQAVKPKGQVIVLDFKLKGIGGGVLENPSPNTLTRDVVIYFFGPDPNTEDKTTRPIKSFKTTVTYDSSTDSPTYGRFVNNSIDLAGEITNGNYQIVFKTQQNLSKLIKKNPKDLGGIIFKVNNSFNDPIKISNVELIPGDVFPSPLGDNIMDKNDYDGVVNCFGVRAETDACPDKAASDLDDNGSTDGTDYNILFGGFKTLSDMGVPANFLNEQAPTKKPVLVAKKPKASPTIAKKTNEQSKVKGSSNVLLISAVIFLFITLGVVIFALRKQIKSVIAKLTHKSNPDEKNKTEGIIEEKINKEYFVKVQTVNKEENTTVLTLTDDNGPTLGYFSGSEVKDGFSKVKGTLKKEGDKVYIDVTELKAID